MVAFGASGISKDSYRISGCSNFAENYIENMDVTHLTTRPEQRAELNNVLRKSVWAFPSRDQAWSCVLERRTALLLSDCGRERKCG